MYFKINKVGHTRTIATAIEDATTNPANISAAFYFM